MKITIEPTGQFEGVNGVRCRVWRGVTDKGVPVALFIPLVQVSKEADNSEFRRELSETKSERELVYFDHRLVAN